MGRLMAVSRLYVDANVYIRLFEGTDELSRVLSELFSIDRNSEPYLATSELTLAEVLVLPTRRKDVQLISLYENWTIWNSYIEVGPIVRDVLRCAAILRASYLSLKLPDAIHLATALLMRCSHFLTADERLGGEYEMLVGRNEFNRVHHSREVSFDAGDAETVALVGESGSGKTVTALSILKLLPYPSASHPSGKIRFKGEDMLTLPSNALRQVRGNKISMIFQEPMTSLNPLHTIEQQVGEVLKIHRGLSDRAARERVLDLLNKVGIADPTGRLQP